MFEFATRKRSNAISIFSFFFIFLYSSINIQFPYICALSNETYLKYSQSIINSITNISKINILLSKTGFKLLHLNASFKKCHPFKNEFLYKSWKNLKFNLHGSNLNLIFLEKLILLCKQNDFKYFLYKEKTIISFRIFQAKVFQFILPEGDCFLIPEIKAHLSLKNINYFLSLLSIISKCLIFCKLP